MSGRGLIERVLAFLADDTGAAMVEFSIVSAVFFLAFYQLFGFGIFASNNLMAEKATQIAARMAVVRPPVCANVPDRITTSAISPTPRFGTNCRAATGTCATQATRTCAGAIGHETDPTTTDGEIWLRIKSMLPPGTAITAMQFTYTFDPNLGYLGGPYMPIVTVAVTVPNNDSKLLALFQTISKFAVLAAGGSGTGFGAPRYRVISISLPAEDLEQGTKG